MSGGFVTFVWTFFIVLTLATAFVYPGIRRRVGSVGQSLLAALMSSALFAAFLALVTGSVVNAVLVILD